MSIETRFMIVNSKLPIYRGKEKIVNYLPPMCNELIIHHNTFEEMFEFIINNRTNINSFITKNSHIIRDTLGYEIQVPLETIDYGKFREYKDK